MAGVKQKYIALTGISFDSRNLRVEAGDGLPGNISAADIEDLLAQGAIKADAPESEGEE